MEHIHEVFDSDVHFSIDHISRAIKNETTNAKTKIIQYDHDSERFTFELPRHIEGHDMLTCNVVQVHYINIGGGNNRNRGLYEVKDLQVSPKDENVVICSWLISQNATQLVGTLNFVLRFVCTTDGELNYVWQTAVYNAIVVAEGIYNSEVIAEEYADILEQWRKELIESGGGAVSDEQIAQAVEDYLTEHPVKVDGVVKTVNGTAPDENGNVEIKIPDSGGNVDFRTDKTLILEDGVLSVNTTDNVGQDNTLPITSAGVFATVGNIEALLKTI